MSKTIPTGAIRSIGSHLNLVPSIASQFPEEEIRAAEMWSKSHEIEDVDNGPRVFPDKFSVKVISVLKSFAERGIIWRPKALPGREAAGDAGLDEMRVCIEAAELGKRVRTSNKKDKPSPQGARAPRALDPAQIRKLDKGLCVILDREPFLFADGTVNKHLREMVDIVNQAQAGMKNPDIARELNISLRTVERRLKKVRNAAEG
jgi:hypothetical protein